MPMPAANLEVQPRAQQLAIAEADQTLDPSLTPYVGVTLQRVGAAPLLLAASGTVALLGDDPEAVSQVALASLVAPPLATDATSLALPLAGGYHYRLHEASLGAVGAAGDWTGDHQWQLSLRSGTSLAPVGTLAGGAVDHAGATAFTVPGAGQLINSSLTPLLTLSADAHGSAPRLLSLRAEARLRALRLATTTFTYDPNGNVISEVTDEEVLTYAWDPSDRLVGVARDAEPVASYLYDATGRRVAATSDAGTTNYLWDEQNLPAELDDALDTLAQYTDYPGVWGGLSSVHTGGASAFYAPDMSSNIRLLLSAAQGVEQASLYGAFGVPLAGATASPLGFGGGLGYFDDGLDRLYVRARHYRPGLGAWMSRDPLGGLLGGYDYVLNQPVGLADPSGRDWLDNAANFSAGLGDTISFGFSRWARRRLQGALGLGTADMVNTRSGWYKAGNIGGQAYWTVVAGGYAAAGAGAFFGAGSIVGGLVEGAVGGALGDAVAQLATISGGGCARFDWWRLGFATSLGAVFGSVAIRAGYADKGDVVVSHWSHSGQSSLARGNWVEVGGANRLSYNLAGGRQIGPYSSGFTEVVPASRLRYPAGIEQFKGLFGQRMYGDVVRFPLGTPLF